MSLLCEKAEIYAINYLRILSINVVCTIRKRNTENEHRKSEKREDERGEKSKTTGSYRVAVRYAKTFAM